METCAHGWLDLSVWMQCSGACLTLHRYEPARFCRLQLSCSKAGRTSGVSSGGGFLFEGLADDAGVGAVWPGSPSSFSSRSQHGGFRCRCVRLAARFGSVLFTSLGLFSIVHRTGPLPFIPVDLRFWYAFAACNRLVRAFVAAKARVRGSARRPLCAGVMAVWEGAATRAVRFSQSGILSERQVRLID